ncbi:uncharacterized protein BO97DRAFT_156038 [Aspergillus homomorphus CBS 101889]|uniref:Uncharacterized protein n=1 Tax=Aspergillus homomorphus (strain CBS 101889) TaxID=1450537 RepID=A0A395HPL4_ASPHC|nr:hypothetical protein BO97DRAFT_156038 [Aspergillus homomorphus CBS 101889]RAL09871.1 hypothetical protein BO97DRAFT_156038 [Aspergillus homomorphus CBS 101889]
MIDVEIISSLCVCPHPAIASKQILSCHHKSSKTFLLSQFSPSIRSNNASAANQTKPNQKKKIKNRCGYLISKKGDSVPCCSIRMFLFQFFVVPFLHFPEFPE